MNDISKTLQVLENNGIIVFPTDTAYGIGCRLDKPKAIERLLTIKGRPEGKAVPVLVSGFEMAAHIFRDITPGVETLIHKYWPGGLTIVYYCRNNLVGPVTGNTDKIGLRMPNHKLPLGIISGIGIPIPAPSANFSGQNTPFSLSQVEPALLEKVDLVLSGECGSIASTVVDCTTVPYNIIRQGAVVLPREDKNE